MLKFKNLNFMEHKSQKIPDFYVLCLTHNKINYTTINFNVQKPDLHLN